MDVTSETFLRILKSALLGEKANLNEEIHPEDWQKLFSMARITVCYRCFMKQFMLLLHCSKSKYHLL